jgi:hypothetical protein
MKKRTHIRIMPTLSRNLKICGFREDRHLPSKGEVLAGAEKEVGCALGDMEIEWSTQEIYPVDVEYTDEHKPKQIKARCLLIEDLEEVIRRCE